MPETMLSEGNTMSSKIDLDSALSRNLQFTGEDRQTIIIMLGRAGLGKAQGG